MSNILHLQNIIDGKTVITFMEYVFLTSHFQCSEINRSRCISSKKDYFIFNVLFAVAMVTCIPPLFSKSKG